MPLSLSARRFVSGAVLVTAFALSSAPNEADAFCRTVTTPLPQSYSPRRGCFEDGLLLFWRNACVSYDIDRNTPANIPLEDATRIVDSAFATWVSTTCTSTGQPVGIAVSNLGPVSCTTVGYNQNGSNQNLIVFRDVEWPYNDPNNTLGLTTVTFNAETGEIYDADLELNDSGKNLSITDVVPQNGYDLASVVTHEAGHFFGLAHATDPRATMYASYRPGTSALRSLTDDDRAGICAIYPNAAERIVSPQVAPSTVLAADACDPTPRHGLASDCGGTTNESSGCSVPATNESTSSASLAVVGLAAVLGLSRRSRKRSA